MIAAADTVMLRVIAERRAEDTRAAIAQAAPGANLSGDLRTSVADLLPPPGQAGAGLSMPRPARPRPPGKVCWWQVVVTELDRPE